jgi:hypothetical protein
MFLAMLLVENIDCRNEMQCYGSVFIWYGSGSSILSWIPIQKNLQLKKKFFFFFKNYNLPIPRPPERTSKIQMKPSALKKRTFLYFYIISKHEIFYFFLLSWVICPPGSGSGYESTDLIESGSETLIKSMIWLAHIMVNTVVFVCVTTV